MDTNIQLYDSVEAIAASFEKRHGRIKAVVAEMKELQLKPKSDYLADHKQDAWREILEKSGALEWMSSIQAQEINDLLYKTPEKLPEITVESLRDWLQSLVTSSPNLIRGLCREAFEILTPQHRSGRDYKSNHDKREIPQTGRVVLAGFCDYLEFVPNWSITSWGRSRLNVLDRVFALLAHRAKSEGVHSTAYRCSCLPKDAKLEIRTFWGNLKLHKNGNLHLRLTDKQLTKRLAEVAGGKTLSK